MLTLRNKYTFRNLSVLNVSAGPVCTLFPTALVFTFHLNCKYHPWGLINDMQMSIYNRKHWHALSHLLHFVRHEGDWRPTRPPQRGSQVPDSVCLGLVPGQIDSPYLFIMPWITIPRDEYYTIFSGRWGSPRGVLGPFQNCPMFPCSHTFSLFVPLLINLLTTYYRPQLSPAKKKDTRNKPAICVTSSQAFERNSQSIRVGMSIRTNLNSPGQSS